MRRSDYEKPGQPVKFKELDLNPETHMVKINEEIIDMSPTEFRLLHFFITHPEKVFSRTQILDQVWGQNVFIEERTVDVHIKRLRKVLRDKGYDQYIQTVRSFGYRFSP